MGGGTAEPATMAWWLGAQQAHRWRQKMGEAFVQSELYVLLHQQKGEWVDTRSDQFWAKYQELKANAECLHIENGLPILTDEQLMFEAAGGNTVTTERWGGTSSSSSFPSVSFTVANEACIKRERRLWQYIQ
ncbi:hypothetical protein M9H77_03400 [Catharanthus roseus]|uniref:Uncharacterized protein n=1 Tax=Catharanthus roseus TaxID=4058 RepID=A0ACC0CBB2_CATRO|nr:hypothetical protein M9H77_03400 [Catharanthus roseus]